MILTYCYRIKPSAEQEAKMIYTLELLRRHWNYCLGQRLDWLRRTRCQINCCSIVSEPIGEISDKVDYYTQQSALKETKQLFPDYKNIWSESQQVNLQRLNKAWERWLFPDKSRKRGGRPRFKKVGELRSFVYPRVNCPKAGAHLNNRVLKLSKIGEMLVVMHRPIPDGFTLKTCTILHKADGWYCCISMQDETVLDAAWGRFITILEAVAVKRGVRVVKVSPHGTSQDCSNCGAKVPKTLSIRLHECHKCGLQIDRDENAARNILDRALNEVRLILSARRGLGDTQPVKREAFSGWDGKQLSLF